MTALAKRIIALNVVALVVAVGTTALDPHPNTIVLCAIVGINTGTIILTQRTIIWMQREIDARSRLDVFELPRDLGRYQRPDRRQDTERG